MSQFVLSSTLTRRTIVIKAVLNAPLLNLLAEAFTPAYDDEKTVHQALTEVFGKREYLSYCLDMSDVIFRVTFSTVSNPCTTEFRGKPCAIASRDASSFELFAEQVDLVKPGRMGPHTFPFNVEAGNS